MITAQDVAAELGLPVDDRLQRCTASAVSWAQKRRCTTDPDALWAEDDAVQGATLFAAMLYQSRATPSGIAGYDEAALSTAQPDALYRARELVGLDPVVS
jgi:hypothetical protein